MSKDAVVSWETGRNQLSATLARRIALVTGVDGRTLRLGVSVPFSQEADAHVYTKEDLEMDSFVQWCERAREDFRKNRAELEELATLARRTTPSPLT